MGDYTLEQALALASESAGGALSDAIHVNIDTREVTVPESQKLFGVESDADVEIKHIIIDGRYADGNKDLSKLAWRVIYRNANKGTSYYLIPSVVANENSIEMNWLIKRSVVAYKGTVDFILCAFATTSSGEVTPEWNSTLGQGIVLEGLETSAIDIGKESVDELAKILYETIVAKDAAAKSAEAAAKSEANAKQSADTLAESVENVAANTAAVAELKEKKAEIEDTAVGANAWSSKHIIDMLCPPLEESGNPVACYPVAGYPLGVKASWGPVQEGSGTPSPENIRPIKGRDSVAVERCGGNILNPKAYEIAYTKGITFTINNDKSIHITGTATTRSVFKLYSRKYEMSLPDGNYVLSTIANVPSGARILIECYYKNKPEYEKNLAEILPGNSFATASFRGVGWLDGYIEVLSGNTIDTTLYPMLVLGTTVPTAYTPYIGSTNALTLPETVYGGEVDAVSGDGNENTKIITLDGTTNMFILSSGFWNLPQNSSPGICSGYDTNCSHFPPGTFGGNKDKGYLFTKPQLLGKYFQDVNAFNAYLAAQYAAGTPVQVCYKLVEPVPFTATGAQAIPALAGVNTVLTDADSATVTGRADPIKRITDLEAAVASIN